MSVPGEVVLISENIALLTSFEFAQEFERRMAIWMDNLAYTVEYNKEHSSHWVSPDL